ncbi:MAG: T9SS type A sorting domain-containing protein [Bacteroidetes bacterium]|nr:T9SS type A sorting domain-containing protein [Bacteroidota bacterium]MBU1720287.1 T9SS type A sorting domain-containing protein [Bacteroidota bacterium]
MQRFVIIGFLLCSIALHGRAQVNLVINPSLEIQDTCPSAFSQLSLASGWDTLRNGGGASPDIFNACDNSVFQLCGVPVNFNQHSFQYAKSGIGYGGFAALYSAPQYREYIQGSLIHKLDPGHGYCVRVYVSLTDHSKFSCNSLGIYLDDGQIHANSTNYELPNVYPQIIDLSRQYDDTIQWMRIEGIYTAFGDEEYLTIGNFFPDSLSNPVLDNPTGIITGAYYYIDDVSVIDINLPAFAGNDTYIHPGDSAFIGRTPEIGLNDDCVWSINGVPFDTIAGMWVKPDSATTYFLEQTICGNVSYDTVTVYVFPVDVNTYAAAHSDIQLYPNPTNGTFTICLIGENMQGQSVEISILDLLGTLIRADHLTLQNNSAIFDAQLSNGVYIVSVKDAEGNIYKPKMITVIK